MREIKKLVSVSFLLFLCAFNIAAQMIPPPMAPPPRITRDNTGKPNWKDRPETAFDKNFYVSAVGDGNDRQRAEASAFRNLTAFFGQSVQGSLSVAETYREQVVKGKITVQSGVEAEEAILISTAMDQLIGAEINDRWYDEKAKTYYAVAVMEKPRAIRLYGELIDSNLRLINTTLDIPAAERAAIDTMTRYHLAASLADTNQLFATVLSLLGGPNRKNDLKTGDGYRYEASNIAKLIPVDVVVENDSAGRVKAAFSSVLTDAGFRPGNNQSRYVINARVSLSPVPLDNPNKFTRYVVDAQLLDTNNNAVLIPFNINGREGHATQAEADNRAIRAAEAKIKDEYAKALSNFLASIY